MIKENVKYYYNWTDYINYSILGHWPIPVVFLHGLGASSKSWHDLISHYSHEEYTVYIIDLKWYGYSTRPKDGQYSIADQWDILARRAEDLDLHDIILVWHSLWGWAALYMYRIEAKREQHRIKKLVLISTMAYKNELPILYKLLANPYTMRFIFTFSSAWFKAKYTLLWACKNHRSINKNMIARYAEFLKGNDRKYVIMTSAQQLIHKDYEDTIKAYKYIHIPVLLIRGENDPVLPLDHWRKLNSIIPHSTIIIFSNCGHIPHEEKTHETYNIIHAWINK